MSFYVDAILDHDLWSATTKKVGAW